MRTPVQLEDMNAVTWIITIVVYATSWNNGPKPSLHWQLRLGHQQSPCFSLKCAGSLEWEWGWTVAGFWDNGSLVPSARSGWWKGLMGSFAWFASSSASFVVMLGDVVYKYSGKKSWLWILFPFHSLFHCRYNHIVPMKCIYFSLFFTTGLIISWMWILHIGD